MILHPPYRTFSAMVREELLRVRASDEGARFAELAGLLAFAGGIAQEEGACALWYPAESAAMARHFYLLARDALGERPQLIIHRHARHTNYTLGLRGEAAARALMSCGLVRRLPATAFADTVAARVLTRDLWRRAYIRGAFLACGSLTNPVREYHCEFATQSATLAGQLCKLLTRYEIVPKVVPRKDVHVVYLKESEQIASLLALMGAHEALLRFTDVRITKGMRNKVNRAVNCERANLTKVVDASARQADSIELLDRVLGLDKLPRALREVAELRMLHRDATLEQLGDMMDPPVKKSGVNHRFNRLNELARIMRDEMGEHDP